MATYFAKINFRIFFVVNFIFIHFFSGYTSQKNDTLNHSNSNVSLFSSNDCYEYLISNYPLLSQNNIHINVLDSVYSKYSRHYLFSLFYKSIPLFDVFIKLNLSVDGRIISEHHNFPASFTFNEKTNYLNTDNIVWFYENEIFSQKEINILHAGDNHLLQIIDSGSVIFQRDLNVYFSDSLANMSVFLPDPLTSAGVYYGAPYSDQNNLDVIELNNERVNVQVPVLFDGSTFFLENQFLKITELSAPVIQPVNRSDPDFLYTRSESGFEDVNAYYHITAYRNYLQTIGFDHVVNYQIFVDTHGNSGSDNSYFTASTLPPRIIFGTGGVDDAEDADVIIHEYGHAISHSLAPSTNVGSQRQAIDEGFCDYLASSYSNTFSSFRYTDVFTWDGHNEFWAGRNTNTTKKFPDNITNNLYQDSEIWSSTLLDIHNSIGREVLDQILFQSMYSYFPFMNMPQAANFMFQADTIIFSGIHSDTLCKIFTKRGLGNNCIITHTRPIIPNNNEALISIYNSEDFTLGGICSVRVKNSELFNFTLYDLSGNIIHQRNEIEQEYLLNGDEYKSGYYIICCESKTGKKYFFKLIKF